MDCTVLDVNERVEGSDKFTDVEWDISADSV
jgi:hypothetical protein